MDQVIKLFNEDTFEAMSKLEDNSIDMVCVDPPFGTTAIEWDDILPFDKLWAEYKRIVKDKGMIIIFGSQPFSSMVVASNPKWFRHELIWHKNKCGSPGLAKYRQMKVHENILVFSQKSGGTYNPIMEAGEPFKRKSKSGEAYGTGKNTHKYGLGGISEFENKGTRYPKSVVFAPRNFSAQQQVHPTQKPTTILSWLIQSFSNEGDVILDNTMGSGSCGIAAIECNRGFVGIERDEEYFTGAKERIEATNRLLINSKGYESVYTQLSK